MNVNDYSTWSTSCSIANHHKYIHFSKKEKECNYSSFADPNISIINLLHNWRCTDSPLIQTQQQTWHLAWECFQMWWLNKLQIRCNIHANLRARCECINLMGSTKRGTETWAVVKWCPSLERRMMRSPGPSLSECGSGIWPSRTGRPGSGTFLPVVAESSSLRR